MTKKYIKKIEAAWGAAMIDAEGCIGLYTRKNSKSKSTTIRVGMSDEDSVLKLQKIFGGSVNGPYNAGRRKKHKDIYVWQVSSHADVRKVLETILPLLSIRRTKKANEVLKYLEKRNGVNRRA